MKRSGLSMAAMVATVVMVLTVSTYAITARAVNPVVGLSFQGTTAVCHAKCFAGSDSGTVSGVVYDLFPAGIGPEREFRVIGFGTEIAYGPDRFPVRCLDRFDYRLLLHTTSE